METRTRNILIIVSILAILLLFGGSLIYYFANQNNLDLAPSAPGSFAPGPADDEDDSDDVAPGTYAPSRSATGPSASGPSASGPSASGPSASGPSASGPSASGPSAPVTLPTGRFIRLIQTTAAKLINLAELEVFDANGVNLASGKTVTGSSEYSTEYGYVNLTDGIKTNFAHTKGKTVDEYDYLQVDLGALKEIKKIVITNRTTNKNSIKDRAKGIKAIIYANDGTTLVKETPVITKRANTYTLTFPENVWS